MKNVRKLKLAPTALVSAVAILSACQMGAPTNTATDRSIGTSNGQVNVLKPGEQVQTNPNLANPNLQPNATVKGRVLDTFGKPIAGVVVTTLGGQMTTTDSNGNYIIQVAAEKDKEVILLFQKPGFVYSSDRVMLEPGDTIDITSDIKQADPKVNLVKAATGGTYANSTGVLEIDVPEGALDGDTKFTLTPLSFGNNGSINELPGPLESVDENGNRQLLMPVEYWHIDMEGGNLKEGESITMRMKLPANDIADIKVKGGDLIPCYIYDAQLGYWNSPNLGPVVEKDGALWATYEIKRSSLTDRVNPTRTVQQTAQNLGPDPLPGNHRLKNQVVRINCGGVDENGNATTSNLGSGGGGACNEDELAHNAWVDRQKGGGATNFLGTQVRGISGGHTWFNLYGTNIAARAIDWNDQPLSDVQIKFTSGNTGARTTGADGLYTVLQYRNINVNVTAGGGSSQPYLVSQSASIFTGNNPQPVPRNQFGRNVLYENTVSVTRGNKVNGSDVIQAGAVSELLRVSQGGKDFVIGRDCLLDVENRISWSPDNPKPTPVPTPTPTPTPEPSQDPEATGANQLRHVLAGNPGPIQEPDGGTQYQVKYHYPDPNLTIQGRQPERIQHNFKFNTRHPMVVKVESNFVSLSKLTFEVKDKASGEVVYANADFPANLRSDAAFTAKTALDNGGGRLKRGNAPSERKYVLTVKGDGAAGTAEFGVKWNEKYSAPITVGIKLTPEAK